MRKLYLSRNSFAQSAKIVRDEHDQSQYLLVGKWGRRQDAISLYTISGELLAEVRQTSLGLLPKFDLFYERQKVGSITKTLGFWHEMIYISKLRWLVMGSLTSQEFRIYHGTDLLMLMRPVVTLHGEAYELQITANEESEAILICIAAVLDHWRKLSDTDAKPAKNTGWSTELGGANYTLHYHRKLLEFRLPRELK